ncbi:hypothetical protein LCGC14_3090930 [marine sediment metagenome]|uniref:Uncharacterized protein n=1 Tax=marine sediment metagenome TaxID=412755 RepID=A0A0F8Z0X9_9ZZZZ
MAHPTDKHPQIENFLEATFGRTTAITTDTCVSCKESANEFKDEISKKEYRISGLCQNCQDEVFDIEY